jgi:hypothetical protein
MTTQQTKYVLRVTRILVIPENAPLFSYLGASVEMDANEENLPIRIKQESGTEGIVISGEEEWNAISAAVADLFAEIKKHHTEEQP